MSPLIAPELLLEKLDVVRLLDARTGKDAHAAYLASHIRGAQFVDLETALAAPSDPSHGGRHPLPSIEAFATRIGALGIDPSDEVVVYDADRGTNAAARCWWMLRAIGHTYVRVLDGGLEAATKIGIPLESGDVHGVAKPPYPTTGWRLPTIDIDGVARAASEQDAVVLDARSPERFRGESEPIDPVAGHIPGAVNVFHRTHLDADGRMLSPEALRAQLEPAIARRSQVIASCGSGVTACHTILAMAHAGLEIPALYVGSWSEWCRSGRPRDPA